nr:MAG TPA: hypothetical protein [Caudoviricetes sp.]
MSILLSSLSYCAIIITLRSEKIKYRAKKRVYWAFYAF